RMENTTFIDTLYGQLESSVGKIKLGSGKIFENEPKELRSTDGGYGGTISQFAFDNTEYGLLFVSCNSRTCFTISETLNPISKGASNFLYDNLPFQLSKQIDVLSIDNACNPEGIGILSQWDRTSGFWFITKKDYRVINPEHIPLLKYKEDKLLYLNGRQVSLSDESIFENCSWTFAYSPERKRWITWHSFLPNFYLTEEDIVFSGENKPNQTDVWEHNIPGIYCNFYGKQYPFIIEGVER